MPNTTNYSRDQIAALFRKLVPHTIDVESVEETDIGFRVTLAYGSMKSDFLIPKTGLMSDIQEIISHRICSFSQRIGEQVEKQLDLESYFREKYADKNVIYKVPKDYETTLAPRKVIVKNLVLFYGDRIKDVLPNYDSLWRRCVYENFSHENIQVLKEYLHGAFERLKQVSFAKERIDDLREKMEREGKMDNDILFLIDFHFYYFITLIRTLGDNLAWILNYYCKMNLENDPKNIDLATTKFKDALKREKREIFAKICQGSGHEGYCQLRDFRDIVVHRHALHVVPVFFVKSPRLPPKALKVMVPTEPTTGVLADQLDKTRKTRPSIGRAQREAKDSIAKYGLLQAVYSLMSEEELRKTRKYEDIESFCQKHFDYVLNCYNETINMIVKEI